MVAAESRQLALMSIHSEYAEAIIAGDKRVEFRKRSLSPSITHVLIYATKPRAEIVGVFEVVQQEVMSPEQLWDKLGDQGFISHHDFGLYYAGYEHGVGIHIGNVTAAKASVSLQALGVSRPPQSVQYLDVDLHDAIAMLCPGRVAAD